MGHPWLRNNVSAFTPSALPAGKEMGRRFATADKIQAQLNDVGVYVHARQRREWRADGRPFKSLENHGEETTATVGTEHFSHGEIESISPYRS